MTKPTRTQWSNDATMHWKFWVVATVFNICPSGLGYGFAPVLPYSPPPTTFLSCRMGLFTLCHWVLEECKCFVITGS